MKRDADIEAALAFAYRTHPDRHLPAVRAYCTLAGATWAMLSGEIVFSTDPLPIAELKVQDALMFAARRGHARALDEYCENRNLVWGVDDDGGIVFLPATHDAGTYGGGNK